MSRTNKTADADPDKKPLDIPKAGPAREKNGETVTVALKHPTGIVMEAFREERSQEPVLGGGFREVKVWRSTGRQYPINGNRVPFGQIPDYKIVGGYALTEGVPKDVYDIWCEQHSDSPLVEHKLLMAFASSDRAEGFAREHASTRSGMEPVAKSGDPRVDKKRTHDGKVVDGIVVADEQPAERAA